MNPLDEAKMAHHATPQQEMISKLHNENLDLKEKILYLEEKCRVLNIRWMEAQEKLIDYQRLLRAMRAIESMEAWFSDDEDEDETYKTHDGELQ